MPRVSMYHLQLLLFKMLGSAFAVSPRLSKKRLTRRISLVVLCTITAVASIPLSPVLAQSRRSEQVSDNRILMPFTGSVEITVNNAVTNSCDGNFGLYAPQQQELVQNYNNKRGETDVVGPFEAGTELIFYIEPLSFCGPYTYLSTNTSHARVFSIAEGIWRIEWEDLPDNAPPDNDFDDLIITVRVTGAYPDFKQNVGEWADDIYDHNTTTDYLIAGYGCALTSVTNLLAYYGARDIDPGIFNTWMKGNSGFNEAGAVWWNAANRFRPQGSDVQVIEWVRNVSHTDPTLDMRSLIRESLQKRWPVIIQLNMPASPTGVHYPVLVDLVETPGDEHYVVKDPLSASNSITRLSVNDPRILKAILYRPADQLPRTSLVIYGLSPIEFMVVDALGRRLGHDPDNDIVYWEIPDASYDYDPPFWNPTGVNPNGEGSGLVATLPGASAGAYQLHVHGTGTGAFELETFYDSGNSGIKYATRSGTTQQGVSALYDLEVGTVTMNIVPQQTMTVTAQPSTVVPGGTSTVSVIVRNGFGDPLVGQTVLFDSSSGNIQGSAVTDSSGVARVTLQTERRQGTAGITTRVGDLVNRLEVSVQGSNLFLPKIERVPPPVPPTEMSISTNSPNSYQLRRAETGDGMGLGKQVYTDRNYVYSGVPSLLQGASYVQTSNNDSVKYDLALAVNVNKPFQVFVAHTDLQVAKPSWLYSFQDTGYNVTFTDREDNTVVLSVYSASFPAGTVTLGANTPPGGDDHSMYTVAIKVNQAGSLAESE